MKKFVQFFGIFNVKTTIKKIIEDFISLFRRQMHINFVPDYEIYLPSSFNSVIFKFLGENWGDTVLQTNFGTHKVPGTDCLGFGRSPRYCENTEYAMATGCFKGWFF